MRWVLVGFGEAASGLMAAGFLAGGDVTVCLPFRRPPSARTAQRLAEHGVTPAVDPKAVRGADVVLSLVTPDAAVDAARAVAPHLGAGTLYVDLNSIARQTVLEISSIVEARGAGFVDAAIMGPVPLQRLAVPIWLSGGSAAEFHALATHHGLNTRLISGRAGDASALKMLWSVLTKGTIALYAEALIGAHRLGLLEPMLEMVASEYGATGTPAMVKRMLGSTAASGGRRLGEMEEARKTVESVGLPTWTVDATLKWIAALTGLPGVAEAADVPATVAAASDALDVRSAAGGDA
jgi:3-hydroxyisobutyrate dehydrogenase-like beta-hydroxyacid dehydrogenase